MVDHSTCMDWWLGFKNTLSHQGQWNTWNAFMVLMLTSLIVEGCCFVTLARLFLTNCYGAPDVSMTATQVCVVGDTALKLLKFIIVSLSFHVSVTS